MCEACKVEIRHVCIIAVQLLGELFPVILCLNNGQMRLWRAEGFWVEPLTVESAAEFLRMRLSLNEYNTGFLAIDEKNRSVSFIREDGSHTVYYASVL